MNAKGTGLRSPVFTTPQKKKTVAKKGGDPCPRCYMPMTVMSDGTQVCPNQERFHDAYDRRRENGQVQST